MATKKKLTGHWPRSSPRASLPRRGRQPPRSRSFAGLARRRRTHRPPSPDRSL